MEKFSDILDKICDPVTVRSFSKKWDIPPGEAIRILEKYVRSKGEPVWSLYEVSGTVAGSEFPFLLDDQKVHKHVVVPESQLEETKSKFEEVTSTRLHSIQRTNPKDTRVYGREWANNDDLQGKSVPKQTAKLVTAEVKNETKSEATSSKKSVAAEPTKKTIIAPKNQTSVASMFAKKAAKPSEQVAEKSASPPPPQKESSRKRPKIEIDEPEKKEATPEPKRSVFDLSGDEFPSSREQTPEKSSPPAKKSKKVNDENKKQTKTKKKLIVPVESDDDEKMEIDQKTPKKEKSGTPSISGSTERRRTTRIEKVTETYVDEDGYLVSKEVQKAVECTPSPEKPKQNPKITAPVPGTSKPGKKTATITSFFKKA